MREEEKDLGPEELARFAKAMEGALREFARVEREWAAVGRVMLDAPPQYVLRWSVPNDPATWGPPAPPPDENSDADLVATLLDYVRAGDEAGFRELAAMRGVTWARLEALWVGAAARVGRAGGPGRCPRCHARLEHPTQDGHAMPCPGMGGVRRP